MKYTQYGITVNEFNGKLTHTHDGAGRNRVKERLQSERLNIANWDKKPRDVKEGAKDAE